MGYEKEADETAERRYNKEENRKGNLR